MLKNLTKLLVSLSLVSNLSYADTTGNLVSQDFTTGWTNTGNSYHGSNTIAGHHNGTVESDSVSLNAEGINKESLNNGFSITGSANVWFWNNETQSVTQTIKTVDDNGEVITQNRTLSGSCATWNGCTYGSMTDTLIIGSNTQQDYDVNLKYTFNVPNQTSGHYGADLKDPSLTVSYTYVPPLDSATQTALFDLNTDIKDDLKDIDNFTFKNEDFKFEEEPMTLDMQTENFQEDKIETTFQDTFTDTESFDNKEDQTLESFQSEILDDENTTSSEPTMADEEMSIETNKEEKEESPQTAESTEDNEQTQDSSESQQVSQQNSSESKKNVSLEKTMEKIDAKVKDIGTNLGLKNIVKLKAMVDKNILSEYENKAFYQEKRIYENQADIRDNRVLYANVSLVLYTQNDPIFTKEKELFTIKLEKEKLQKEIEVLKNGF